MQLRSYSAAHRKERQEGPYDLSPSNGVRSTMLSSEADRSSPRPPQKARFGNYCLSLKLKGQDGPSAPGHRSSAAREGGTWTGAAAQRWAQRAGRTGAARPTGRMPCGPHGPHALQSPLVPAQSVFPVTCPSCTRLSQRLRPGIPVLLPAGCERETARQRDNARGSVLFVSHVVLSRQAVRLVPNQGLGTFG